MWILLICSIGIASLVGYRSVRKVKDIGAQGYVLDTSALLDGRLGGLTEIGVLAPPFLVPSRVLAELNNFINSRSAQYKIQRKKAHGALEWLKSQKGIEYDTSFDSEDADQQVVLLAVQHNYRAISLDKQVLEDCRVSGVPSLNLDALEYLAKASLAIGDEICTKLRYKGHKGASIAVLPNGEAITVLDSSRSIGGTRNIRIISMSRAGNRRVIEAELIKER